MELSCFNSKREEAKILLKDKIMVGALIGIFSDAVKLTSNYIMYKLGWTSVVFWQIVAARFLTKDDLSKPSALFIGAVADITVSAILGIGFVYFVYLFGRKFLFIKGIGYGLLIWVVLLGSLLSQTIGGKITPTPPGIIVTMIAHFIFGLSMTIFTKLLFKDSAASEKSIEKIKSFSMNLPLAPEPASKPLSFKIKNNNTSKKPIKLKPKKLIKDK